MLCMSLLTAMRILCLHGHQSSGQTLASEIASITESPRSNVALIFDFPDGPLRNPKEPSDGEVPRYSFYETPTINNIRTAHTWLNEKLENNGPYDGVIAFSQGAALVSSYTLYQQWYHHESPLPFRFAVFLSGIIPLDVLKDLGVPVSNEAERIVKEAEDQLEAGSGPSATHVAKARRAEYNSDDCFGINLNRLPLELKIRIPTVHIWGKEDPLLPTSIHLAGLCDPYIRKIHIHNEGHVIPKGEDDVAEIGQLLQWCVARATWPGHKQE